MEPLKRKKIGRTALRNHFKKLEKEVETLLKDFDRSNLAKLKSLKTNLENQISKIQKADEEVQSLMTEEKVLIEDIENSMLESDIYFDVLSNINACLENEAKKDVKNIALPSKLTPTTNELSEESQCKLPKLDPPSFDGNILNWQTFWDQFESSVHNKVKLSEVDKFTYQQLPKKGGGILTRAEGLDMVSKVR